MLGISWFLYHNCSLMRGHIIYSWDPLAISNTKCDPFDIWYWELLIISLWGGPRWLLCYIWNSVTKNYMQSASWKQIEGMNREKVIRGRVRAKGIKNKLKFCGSKVCEPAKSTNQLRGENDQTEKWK